MPDKITRRLALALSGTALASAQPPKLQFGFSLYGARSLPWRDGIDLVARIGYRSTELCLRAGWNTEPKLLTKADRLEIRKRLGDSGLALPSVMENIFPGRPDGLNANLERLRAAAEMCHECSPGGSALIETPLGGRPDAWEQRKNAMAEELASWAREAERLNTTVAIKPHSKLAMSRPERALWMLEQVNSPRIRLVYDYSHYEVQGLDMKATMEQIVPYAVFAHVKDSTGPGPEFKFLLPGDGKIDYHTYVKTIAGLGYRGPNYGRSQRGRVQPPELRSGDRRPARLAEALARVRVMGPLPANT